LCAIILGFAWTTGLVLGLAAMAGDLISSFLKRRMGLRPSSMALGLDQIPESLLPALVSMNLMALTAGDVVVIVVLFFVGELVLSRLLYRVHLRDQPY
jgi:CDP-2,3-bis-(O-geranylgeranyl)-sn-glycerol synthase